MLEVRIEAEVTPTSRGARLSVRTLLLSSVLPALFSGGSCGSRPRGRGLALQESGPCVTWPYHALLAEVEVPPQSIHTAGNGVVVAYR